MRGVGLIGAVELVADKAKREATSIRRQKVGPRLAKLCEKHGVIGRAMTERQLGFCPPLIITEDEIDEMLDRVGRALDELTVELRRESIAAV